MGDEPTRCRSYLWIISVPKSEGGVKSSTPMCRVHVVLVSVAPSHGWTLAQVWHYVAQMPQSPRLTGDLTIVRTICPPRPDAAFGRSQSLHELSLAGSYHILRPLATLRGRRPSPSTAVSKVGRSTGACPSPPLRSLTFIPSVEDRPLGKPRTSYFLPNSSLSCS